MILMRYSLQIKHSLRFCFQPPLTVPWIMPLGSRAKKLRSVRRTEPGSVRSRCRTAPTLPLPACLQPSNVPAASARAATPLQPTSPKWLTSTVQTVDSCGAEMVGPFNAIMPSWSELKQKHKHKQKYKKYCNLPHKQKYTNLRTYHHQPSCLPASNLNKNININKNTKNIAIFLINKNTPTFEVITISHHALLLTDFWGPSTLQLPFCLPLSKWIGNRLLDLSSFLPPSWGPGTQLSPWARPARDPLNPGAS